MTLEEARDHIGHGVVYDPGHPGVEQGVITSVGFRWAFVRYGSDTHSKATDPGALTLLAITDELAPREV